MPRPSQKDAILRAALRCFATLGYDGARIKHIAAAAGVSEGALYRHFPSKEAVAQALFLEHMGAYTSHLLAAMAAEETARGKLAALARVTLWMYHDRPDAMAFVLIGPRPPVEMPQPYPVDLVADVISYGQAHGETRAGDPRLLAAMVLGCILRPIIIAQAPPQQEVTILDAPGAEETLIAGMWGAIQA